MAKDKNNFDPGSIEEELKFLIKSNPSIGELFKSGEDSFYKEIDSMVLKMVSDKVNELMNSLSINEQFLDELVEDKTIDMEIEEDSSMTQTDVGDTPPSILRAASKFEKITKKIKT